MFTTKTAQLEEYILQDLTDEQLGQVAGGGLAGCLVSSLTGDGSAALGTATGRVTGLANSVSVSGVQVHAAGASASTPALSSGDLLSGLL